MNNEQNNQPMGNMQNQQVTNNVVNTPPIGNVQSTSTPKVINVNSNVKDGQLKCLNCGSSDITPNPKTGKLRCNYCYTEFEGRELQNVVKNVSNLQGTIIGAGTTNINKTSDNIITLKCGGCGAEVVIDTSNATHARCHWCRSVLSINNKLENGSIPDVILPFKTTKEEAQKIIGNFVKSRRFFANPNFKKEFKTDNIMGVYFPYLIVDGNGHAHFSGQGERLIRRYTVSRGGDREEVRYVADLYEVEREFDIAIDDLTIESNSTRLDKSDDSQTNNIINSIMPFDTENCVAYQGNYLVGYTSERRDTNISDLQEQVNKQLKDIARYAAKQDVYKYDRGVHWSNVDFNIKGSQWLAAYLPVWLYSYCEVKGDKKVLHYVAVNARTNETMGSIPINKTLLYVVTAIIEVIAVIISAFLFFSSTAPENMSGEGDNYNIFILFLLSSGLIFYQSMYSWYRNKEARHVYERETKKNVTNMQRKDVFIRRDKDLRNSHINGRNDDVLEGENNKRL